MKVLRANITRSDRTWIEKAAMRLVALRNSANIAAVATRLGMGVDLAVTMDRSPTSADARPSRLRRVTLPWQER